MFKFLKEWYVKSLIKRIKMWEQKCFEAQGRYNYWIEAYAAQKMALDHEKERTAKLLRKLAYYRRKLKKQTETTESKGESPK